MTVSLVHLSDLHFGVHANLDQVKQLEGLVPELAPSAIVITGDLSQRSRHGEYQRALAFVRVLERTAPVFVIPGNHDVAWWASPFGLAGRGPLYAKYQQYFGKNLSPVLEVPGAVVAGALSCHGVAFGSMTWNLRDLAVKGHLPKAELDHVGATFRKAPATSLRVVALHHNVLRGDISRRMGLARWKQAQKGLRDIGADLVLCGHDHQESMGQIDGSTVVAASSTHSSRTRGQRPTVFNVIACDASAIVIRQMRWDRDIREFRPGDEGRFARTPR